MLDLEIYMKSRRHCSIRSLSEIFNFTLARNEETKNLIYWFALNYDLTSEGYSYLVDFYYITNNPVPFFYVAPFPTGLE